MPAGVDLFEAPHNQPITWDHLLRQTSDWQGTLWGKPDWADRPEGKPDEWSNRKVHPPGTRYKYNDVRVNVLALAALHRCADRSPGAARGGSDRRVIHAALAATKFVDRARRREGQSVTGGGHWGGDVHQRLGPGALRLPVSPQRQMEGPPDRRGEWIRMARRPGPQTRSTAANWFLNGRKVLLAGWNRASRSAARGRTSFTSTGTTTRDRRTVDRLGPGAQ